MPLLPRVLATAMLIAPVIFFVDSANAAIVQIEGGDIYQVKTAQGSNFGDVASADASGALTYRIRILNSGQDCLNNLAVKVDLPNSLNLKNISTATIKVNGSAIDLAHDTATVNLSSVQKINMIPGSVQLLDANGGVLGSLSDSAVAGIGAVIGQVCPSTNNQRFVQFQASISGPALISPPTSTTSSAASSGSFQTPTPQAPTALAPTPSSGKDSKTLPNTGTNGVLGIFIAAGIIGANLHMAVRRLRIKYLIKPLVTSA